MFLASSSIFVDLGFWERLNESTFEIIRSVMEILRRVSLEVVNF